MTDVILHLGLCSEHVGHYAMHGRREWGREILPPLLRSLMGIWVNDDDVTSYLLLFPQGFIH